MYKVIEDLKKSKRILVIDLTSGLGTKSYHDKNIKSFDIDDKTDIKLPGIINWTQLSSVNPDDTVGYQNIIVRNLGWPSELMIFQDYGNHEGTEESLSFDERVLFPGLILGTESVGYYDGAISVIYRVLEKIFVFKICPDTRPDISRIRKKRPTNINYSLTSKSPDARVIVSVLFQYKDEDPNWKEIMIPGMTAWDIHNPSWIKWIFKSI
jgi:hypothetical protein